MYPTFCQLTFCFVCLALSLSLSSQALPLARFRDVLTLTVGRLVDKSVNVCKNAIQLLAAFMANNPFTWKVGFLLIFKRFSFNRL